ncbi:beta-alanine synthetase [Sorangium cellulosum]|uniref:Beta-alanine synthetase n=1 Tax=Sorangium cellulosum TaxID=56 RepID=A0A2L0EV62_SORCE|nr:carbon-nitrogen hydrolase family protein [Sorangium cellulosum]AUX43190.1 beta-alanine synthetase [Sorangium cellulosum]
MVARALDVVALELPQRFGDPPAAFAEIDRLLGSPAFSGADLVLLPELILTGYVSPRGDCDLRRFAEPLEGESARGLAELARRHAVALAGPLVEESRGRFYNSLLVFDRDGRRVGHYRKRHPWFPERWAAPGDLGTPVLDLLGLRVTTAICFDVHFLSDDAGDALDGADLLLFPTAWVDPPGEGDARAELLPALARRHHVAVVNANWGPSRPALLGQGGSRILDAEGRLLAAAPSGPGPSVVRATLRLA